MKRDPLLYGVVGFLIGVFVIWVLATNAVNNNYTPMMGMRGGNFGMANSNTLDAHFIEQMTHTIKML